MLLWTILSLNKVIFLTICDYKNRTSAITKKKKKKKKKQIKQYNTQVCMHYNNNNYNYYLSSLLLYANFYLAVRIVMYLSTCYSVEDVNKQSYSY